ncbi:MAG: hypothetical protein EA411_01515 [Saprospirales bacterium]|nr:MAG: hypothetical protein EA411_01515 [Saprospirales bacterium]
MVISVKEAVDEENDTLPDLSPPPPYESFSRSFEEYRMLYFIHGLNGTDESWSSAHGVVTTGDLTHQFPARQVYPWSPNYYNAQGTLLGARGSVQSSISGNLHASLPQGYNKYEGIAIGHSQGGIVGRALDEYYSQRDGSGNLVNAHERFYGGLVTVATPNQGAQILNNEDYIRGLVFDLADNLSVGPVTEFTSSPNFFVRLLSNLINLEEMREEVVNFIGNDVGSFLLAEGMPGITSDYTVPDSPGGSGSKIPFLNDYDPVVLEDDDTERNTDLVAFYAVADLVKTYNNVEIEEIVGFESGPYISQPFYETTIVDEIIVPVSWATIHFQLNSPNNDIDPFEADDQDYLTAYQAHKTKNFYDSKFLQNAIEADNWRSLERGAIRSFPPNIPGYFYARSKRKAAQDRRNAWERGSVFLSKFDELYRIMIGARYSEVVTTTHPNVNDDCECFLPNGQTIIFDCVEAEDHYPNADCVEIPTPPYVTIELVWHNKDSDGVVLVESQRDIPQHTHDPVPLFNVTHMQVRNSIRTAEMLETVFEGGVGDFFRTYEK